MENNLDRGSATLLHCLLKDLPGVWNHPAEPIKPMNIPFSHTHGSNIKIKKRMMEQTGETFFVYIILFLILMFSVSSLAIFTIFYENSEVLPTGRTFCRITRNGSKKRQNFQQCCGSGMFIPDPGYWFLPIPDPGSKNSYKREGWKKI